MPYRMLSAPLKQTLGIFLRCHWMRLLPLAQAHGDRLVDTLQQQMGSVSQSTWLISSGNFAYPTKRHKNSKQQKPASIGAHTRSRKATESWYLQNTCPLRTLLKSITTQGIAPQIHRAFELGKRHGGNMFEVFFLAYWQISRTQNVSKLRPSLIDPREQMPAPALRVEGANQEGAFPVEEIRS